MVTSRINPGCVVCGIGTSRLECTCCSSTKDAELSHLRAKLERCKKLSVRWRFAGDPTDWKYADQLEKALEDEEVG
jgi:hypothetical protein